MTTVMTVQPGVAASSRAAVWQLARIEGGRMLRHPAPWLGLAFTLWFGYDGFRDPSWGSQRYQALLASVGPLLLGVSLAAVSAFGRELVAVADDAPVERGRRAVARLVGSLGLVGLVALVVAGTSVWLRLRDGFELGHEPGLTLHAHYTLPELLQPVALACFAVAVGAAGVHLLRQRLAASIVMFLGWFLTGATYWMFQGDLTRWVTPMLVQPLSVEIGPADTDPTTFPADWLLSPPDQYQPGWERLVVSPSVAAWHDVYLLAATALLLAVAVPGRARRPLFAAGAILAVVAVLMQNMVAP